MSLTGPDLSSLPRIENREQLAADVADAIRDLEGLNADEVAAIVQDRIGTKRAVCGNPHSCAIALYVIERVGLPEEAAISVSPGRVLLYDAVFGEALDGTDYHGTQGWHDEYRFGFVRTPQGVDDFIARFDNGDYPDLATEESLAELEQESDLV